MSCSCAALSQALDFAQHRGMDSRVVILSGSHLCHNPRVIKEGITLANAGYNVSVLGAWFDRSLKARDLDMRGLLSFTPVIDTTESVWRSTGARVSNKIGSIAHRFAGIENRRQLGHCCNALSRVACRQPADLYIAHSEPAMAVSVDLLGRGRRAGVDMEDWFSEDLLPEARRSRPLGLLRNLERRLLTTGSHSTCPSRAMSEALAKEFGCSPPTVVYNAFPWSERNAMDGLFKDRGARRLPSIHWFSQTIGRGRGLEDLIAALPLLSRAAEIHLRGNPAKGIESWLAERVPEGWRGRIAIHGLASNAELLSRIGEHDIGFAGETPFIRSRDLTVTNKILQYLLAGLAVVASDTAGQREVAAQAPGAVFLYPSGDAAALAARLDALLGSADALARAGEAAALEAAEQTFCWERQEKALLESVARALRSPARREEAIVPP